MATHSKEENKKFLKWFFIGIGIFVFVIILLALIKVPYEVSYTEREPYQTTEYYTYVSNYDNCDYTPDCACLSKTWFGLGNCYSCNCMGQREITQYRDVEKTRTDYCSLLSKIGGRC